MNIRFNQHSIAKFIDPGLHTVENQQLPITHYINVDVARTTKLVTRLNFFLKGNDVLVGLGSASGDR